MTEREQIEQAIREALVSETEAILLSDKLFGPSGLFGRLGATKEERLAIGQTPLFKQAQKRLRELQYQDARGLSRLKGPQQDQVPTEAK